jgi:hypothetical protein
LAIKYTGTGGLQVGLCETTGFLDQTTEQLRHVSAYTAASGVSSITPVAGAPLVLHTLNADVTVGNATLRVRTFYRVNENAIGAGL